jgi:hypothetical protein
MNEVRAFVGHSFTADDTEIVGAFLKYFDQIHGLYPRFSWEHAEVAEPRELSEKVLSLIEGKNLFIGICTKKERAARPDSLKPVLLQTQYRKLKDSELQWKTSDWIIQEIGLAFGRGLDLILLVEEGLRQPGGLQGNVEYITFKRDSPEKSFGKILEMIRSLSPKPAQAGSATAETVAEGSDNDMVPTSEKKDWSKPQPNWTPEDYSEAAFHLVFDDRLSDLDKLTEKYLETKEGVIGDNKSEWYAKIEFWRVIFGKGGDIEKLKKIAEETGKNKTVLYYLASALRNHDRHLEAATAFEAAAQAAKDDADKQGMLGQAALESVLKIRDVHFVGSCFHPWRRGSWRERRRCAVHNRARGVASASSIRRCARPPSGGAGPGSPSGRRIDG